MPWCLIKDLRAEFLWYHSNGISVLHLAILMTFCEMSFLPMSFRERTKLPENIALLDPSLNVKHLHLTSHSLTWRHTPSRNVTLPHVTSHTPSRDVTLPRVTSLCSRDINLSHVTSASQTWHHTFPRNIPVLQTPRHLRRRTASDGTHEFLRPSFVLSECGRHCLNR